MNPNPDPNHTTIKVSEEPTKKYLDQIKDLRDHKSFDETVQVLIDVYRPFINPKLDKPLKRLGQILVAQGLIPKATEAEVVKFALKNLMAQLTPKEEVEEEEKAELEESTTSVKGGEDIARGGKEGGKERS